MTAEEGPQFTFRQLQIFWAVAQTRSMSRAAKFLDVRQPSISQQINRMESTVGTKLIRYVNTELRLTPAGEYLAREAAQILSAVDKVNAELGAFAGGERGESRIGSLPSMARNLVMPAYALLSQRYPGYTLDIVEVTPREARDELTGRSLDAAVVSDFGVTYGSELSAISLCSDRQLLAVPASLPDLSAIEAPDRELAPADLAVLKRVVRYVFGSDHTRRVNDWYDALAPGAETIVRCRSYDSALPFVEAGLAIALVPDLAVRQGGRMLYGVTLYEMPLPIRPTVLVMPAQNARLPSLAALSEALTDAAAQLPTFEARPTPPFVTRRFASVRSETRSETACAPAI